MLDLHVENLTVTSRTGRRLVSVPELTIPAGSSLAIRGPSGAGKSTLLSALAGLIPITTGHIRWGDSDIAPLPDAARTAFRGQNLGIVFQDHQLFEELSALSNASLAAAYAPRRERATIKATAERVLDDLSVPWQDTRDIDSFSGGERQRIAFARALAAGPKAILADEPTASLDRVTADDLITDLFAQSRVHGRTLIVISHDPKLQNSADQTMTIEEGQVAGLS